MITVYSALPGGGKSLRTAKVALDLLWRNQQYFKKYGVRRMLYSNLRFSTRIEQIYSGLIRYWVSPSELVKLRDVDVVWDEMATHMDNTQWQNMPLELKRWLQQHRKFGVDIYGNTQDFAQIDKSARRLTQNLYYLTKVIGSRDISSTRPPVKYPWGLIFIRSIDPVTYDESKSKQSAVGIPSIMFIRREYVEAFDTRQEIQPGEYPPLRHIRRVCEKDDCQFIRIVHA